MSDALQISEISMINALSQMQTVSHNLANANTIGYKRDIAASSFSELVSVTVDNSQKNQIGNSPNNLPTVKLHTDMSSGVLRSTKNPLDIAIEGNGFLEVTGPSGTMYTRKGSLATDLNGRLVTGSGAIINGLNGEIRLSGSNPVIDVDGNILEKNKIIGTLKIIEFDNNNLLIKARDGLYLQGTAAKKISEGNYKIRQGYLEASNVKTLDEMTKMMTTVRHFEATQRIMKAYDEIMGQAISNIAEF